MRLPIVPPIESRDGTVAKDGLCKNLLVEQDEQGVLSVLRPGLALGNAQAAPSVGRGVVEFNGKLISVYEATLNVYESTFNANAGYQKILDGLISTSESFASDITPDGTRIVGTYKNGSNIYVPFVWDLYSGILNDPGVMYSGKSIGFTFCNSTATKAIGTTQNGSNQPTVFLWDSVGGYSVIALYNRFYWANRECTVCCGELSSGNGFIWKSGVGVIDIGKYAGYNYCSVTCASDNGSIAFGHVYNNSSDERPFVWNQDDGIVLIVANKGQVAGCSFDGSVAVGMYSPTNSVYATDGTLYKWTASGGFEALPSIEGWAAIDFNYSYPSTRYKGCTNDGAKFIGQGKLGGNRGTFIWTEIDGFIDAGDLGGFQNYPYGHSPNGDYIYGYAKNEEEIEQGYFYTNFFGLGMTSMGIDRVPGWGAVSDNGVIAGVIWAGEGVNHAFRWTLTADRQRPLAELTGDFFDFAQSTL